MSWSIIKLMVAGVLGLILLVGCHALTKGSGDSSKHPPASDQITPADSLEHDLIIMDPGFDSWFVTNRKPDWFYDNQSLQIKNYRYVVAWNERVINRLFQIRNPGNPFFQMIDYRPNIIYPLEVNWRLYHYFLYIETTGWPIR